MKKTVLTIAIILGMVVGASAQNKGLFGLGPQRGGEDYGYYRENQNPLINLPEQHGDNSDVVVPLGNGIAMLIGFGAAYALKRRKK